MLNQRQCLSTHIYRSPITTRTLLNRNPAIRNRALKRIPRLNNHLRHLTDKLKILRSLLNRTIAERKILLIRLLYRMNLHLQRHRHHINTILLNRLLRSLYRTISNLTHTNLKTTLRRPLQGRRRVLTISKAKLIRMKSLRIIHTRSNPTHRLLNNHQRRTMTPRSITTRRETNLTRIIRRNLLTLGRRGARMTHVVTIRRINGRRINTLNTIHALSLPRSGTHRLNHRQRRLINTVRMTTRLHNGHIIHTRITITTIHKTRHLTTSTLRMKLSKLLLRIRLHLKRSTRNKIRVRGIRSNLIRTSSRIYLRNLI